MLKPIIRTLTPELMTRHGIMKRFHGAKLEDYFGSFHSWKDVKKIFHGYTDAIIKQEWEQAKENLAIVNLYLSHLDNAIKKGLGLFMHGRSGTGKSLLMMCVAKEALRRGYGARVVSAQGLINLFARSWTDDEVDFEKSIMQAPILFVEELYKENFTSINVPTLTRVIKYREETLRATCFTCNETLESIANSYSQALASAITGTCRICEFDSKLDWRNILQEDWEKNLSHV